LKALRPQPLLRANLESAIQVLIERLLRQDEIPAAITLTEHSVEMSLRLAQSSVDSLVQVLPFLRFRIAAVVNTHQPSAAAAPNYLTNLSWH
jgi:hypothetical protein